jgi:hypothetical protein
MTWFYVNNGDDMSAIAPVARDRLTGSRARLAVAGGQGGVVVPEPGDRLPRRALTGEGPAAVWWLGAHGGAGESTLEQLFSGSRAADHCWPLADPGQAAAHVVLVARTHAHGLKAAQHAIREWAAGDVEVLLLGLVLIADAPGRLPSALRQLAALVAGGVPAVWSVPWIEAWRVGEAPGPQNAPKVVRQLLEDLQVMTEASASVNANQIEEG